MGSIEMKDDPEETSRLRKELETAAALNADLRRYLSDKIDQLLVMMGSKPLDSFQLGDRELLELDPIGTISDAFAQMLANLHEMNEMLRIEIAERKRTEEALREKEERFRTLAEFASDWAFWRGTDGKMHYVSPACEQISGYTPAEFYESPNLFYSVVHPEDRALWRSHCHVVDREGLPGQMEFRIVTKRGETRWISHVCRPVFDEKGEFLGIRGTNVNVTERKRSEEALRESEDRLRDFFDNAIDLIQSVSPDGRFLYVNRAWREVLGYAKEEIDSLTVFDIIAPDCKAHCMEMFGRVMSGEDVGHVETTFLAKDGRPIIVEGHVNCRFENGKPVASRSIFRDVTEKKRLEEEFRKTTTLESIGLLAGGIAHDFNNIITAILGNISLAKGDLSPEEEIFRRLGEAEKASLRAKELTGQLLTFSRGGAPIRKTSTISDLIEETAGFALRGSGVKCDLSVDDGLSPVDVDPGQISQVVNNIVINAVQAMPEGGVVRVRARNVAVPDRPGRSLREGKYVKISIEDSGTGIPKDLLPKIFDPFFTTKEKGTGLGLATSYSIVRRHDGQITVDSKVGRGTTFHIYLPASRKKAPERPPEEVVRVDGWGRVLVMDDEEMLRSVALEILASMGYRGTAVRDGAEAVAAYLDAKEAGAPFDAVIMDLTVPGGMGGKEAVGKILEVDPGARVIVSSGYSNDPVMADFRAFGFRGVIAKPYRTSDLGEVLKTVIEGSYGSAY